MQCDTQPLWTGEPHVECAPATEPQTSRFFTYYFEDNFRFQAEQLNVALKMTQSKLSKSLR